MIKKSLTTALAVLVILFTCSFQAAPALDQTQEVGPYTVSMIEKNVWHVEDCNSSNPHGKTVKANGTTSFNNCSDMYIVRGTKKAILIDLSNKITWADNADQALRKIFYDRAGKLEKLVLITHNHPDHVGMLYAFANEKKVSFLLPEKDFQEDNTFPADRKKLVGDGAKFDLGGLTLECVEVQGHTVGSLVTFIQGHDVAFSGDAIGSGSGVWIFSMDGFKNYVKGVDHLLNYVQDPANGIHTDKLTFWGGHFWQKGDLERLNYQYLKDMQALIGKMTKGEVKPEAYSAGFPYLNANFKDGTATITWNAEDARKFAAENAISHVVDQYIQTINQGNGELVNQIWMHDPHVSFIGPMGRFSTYNEIRDKLVVGIFGTGFTDRNLRKTSLKINITSPETAWLEFEWEFDATRKEDGGHHHALGRETQIMRLCKDGQWRLEHVHYQGVADKNK